MTLPSVPTLPPLLAKGVRPLPLKPLQVALDVLLRSVLARHPQMFERLGAHAGKSFGIAPTDLPFAFVIAPRPPRPTIAVVRTLPDRVAVRIAGPMIGLLGLVDGSYDGDALFFSRDLVVEGDVEAILALRNAVDDAGIDLVGEDRGLMLPLKRWTKGSTLSVPMGQEIAITPIQLGTAFSSIINGGKLLKPRVVAAIVGDDGEILEDHTEAEERRQVLDPAMAKEMTEILTSVVTSGTGKACKLSNWQALGKTGTAQIPRINQGRRGYEPNAYLGSFIGGAPASDPSVVVLVMIRHPKKNGYYGAVVALPAVKEVLEFTLNYLNVPHENIVAADPNQLVSGGGD